MRPGAQFLGNINVDEFIVIGVKKKSIRQGGETGRFQKVVLMYAIAQ